MIKLFTHKDMDGAGCHIVLKNIFPNEQFVVDDLTYKQLEMRIEAFFKRGREKDYDKIFITDLDVSQCDLDFCDILENCEKVRYFDHHPGSMTFTNCEPAGDSRIDTTASATYLLYEWYQYCGYEDELEPVSKLVSLINSYDMWEEGRPKQCRFLNYLYYYYWHEKFVKRFWKGDLNLTQNEKRYIINKEKNLQKEIGQLDPAEFFDGQLMMITGQNFINEVMDYVITNRGAKVAININPKVGSVSLRSKDEEFDVGAIAENFDGGGHPDAGGFKSYDGCVEDIIDYFKDKF